MSRLAVASPNSASTHQAIALQGGQVLAHSVPRDPEQLGQLVHRACGAADEQHDTPTSRREEALTNLCAEHVASSELHHFAPNKCTLGRRGASVPQPMAAWSCARPKQAMVRSLPEAAAIDLPSLDR